MQFTYEHTRLATLCEYLSDPEVVPVQNPVCYGYLVGIHVLHLVKHLTVHPIAIAPEDGVCHSMSLFVGGGHETGLIVMLRPIRPVFVIFIR